MKINLDACPFCGGKGKITAYTSADSELNFYAYCECGAISPHFCTVEECTHWWNTRVFSEKDALLIADAYSKRETRTENDHETGQQS